MKRIYILLMLFLSGVVTYATDVKALAEEATKMYQEGDYQKAVSYTHLDVYKRQRIFIAG